MLSSFLESASASRGYNAKEPEDILSFEKHLNDRKLCFNFIRRSWVGLLGLMASYERRRRSWCVFNNIDVHFGSSAEWKRKRIRLHVRFFEQTDLVLGILHAWSCCMRQVSQAYHDFIRHLVLIRRAFHNSIPRTSCTTACLFPSLSNYNSSAIIAIYQMFFVQLFAISFV